MRIVNVGYDYRHPADFCINRPDGSGDYIMLVLKSTAYFIFCEERQIAYPDSVIVFRKGTPQLYGAVGDEFINDWIHFELDEADIADVEKLEIPFDTILSVHDITEFSGFIKNMFYEKYSKNIYKDDSLNLYFKLMLVKLAEKLKFSEVKKENRYYTELTALRNEIFSKPDNDWNIEVISKKMNLSRSYIQHLYKGYFGESIISDVVNSRMEYAKYLLAGTNISISSVAQMCGYKNDVHFMRVFKNITKLTPSQFRKKLHVIGEEINNSLHEPPFCL